MANRYGPWATMIDAGGNPQLSAFWRRRLTMLVPASRTSPVLLRRHLLWLGAALVLTMVLPTFRFAPAVAGEEKPAGRGDAAATAEGPEAKLTIVEAEGTKVHRWTLTLPDGRTMPMTSSTGSMGGDKGRSGEMKKLIAEKKYEFVKTFQLPNAGKQYVYRFIFADGNRMAMNFSMPLEKVASWDDYQRQRAAQQQQRREKLAKAIAAGDFRLINLEVMQIHLCRLVGSDQKFKVQRIPLPDRKDIALPRPDFSKIPASVKRTTWEEHLQAIRDGKRELLALETVKFYTYEVLLDDGTKTVFNYGGDQPLGKPQEEDR